MTCTKRCPILRQPCPQPHQCGNGCFAGTDEDDAHARATAAYVSRDFHRDSGYPVVGFDAFIDWLRGLPLPVFFFIWRWVKWVPLIALLAGLVGWIFN